MDGKMDLINLRKEVDEEQVNLLNVEEFLQYFDYLLKVGAKFNLITDEKKISGNIYNAIFLKAEGKEYFAKNIAYMFAMYLMTIPNYDAINYLRKVDPFDIMKDIENYYYQYANSIADTMEIISKNVKQIDMVFIDKDLRDLKDIIFPFMNCFKSDTNFDLSANHNFLMTLSNYHVMSKINGDSYPEKLANYVSSFGIETGIIAKLKSVGLIDNLTKETKLSIDDHFSLETVLKEYYLYYCIKHKKVKKPYNIFQKNSMLSDISIKDASDVFVEYGKNFLLDTFEECYLKV